MPVPSARRIDLEDDDVGFAIEVRHVCMTDGLGQCERHEVAAFAQIELDSELHIAEVPGLTSMQLARWYIVLVPKAETPSTVRNNRPNCISSIASSACTRARMVTV